MRYRGRPRQQAPGAVASSRSASTWSAVHRRGVYVGHRAPGDRGLTGIRRGVASEDQPSSGEVPARLRAPQHSGPRPAARQDRAPSRQDRLHARTALREGQQAQATASVVAVVSTANPANDFPSRADLPTTGSGVDRSGKHRGSHDQRQRDAGQQPERLNRNVDEQPDKLRIRVAAMQRGRRCLPERDRRDHVHISTRER
jgi:hypothetical protein